MIKAGALDKGMAILWKDQPYIVAEREFVKPGKGSSFVRAKLKSPKTGQVLRETFKTQDQIEEIVVDDVDFQFLYSDGEFYHFMNAETYEQIQMPVEGFEDKQYVMKEGETYRVTMWEKMPLDIVVPYKVVYEVTEAEEAVKGDTVTGATKLVTIETGLQVKVPIFIKQGEKILINTETKEYIERVNS